MYFTHQIITGDLFNITNRIKEIDKGYFIAYHYKKKRYEVHNKFQKGDSFCLAIPYNQLDNRTINLVLRTRAERIERLLSEIEQDNLKLRKKVLNDAQKSAENNIEKMIG